MFNFDRRDFFRPVTFIGTLVVFLLVIEIFIVVWNPF